MNIAASPHIQALLLGLTDDVVRQLSAPLKTMCTVRSADLKAGISGAEPHIIFCNSDMPTVKHLRRARPDTAIVVVSRHPETADWLDAIEAGATDYCAAPFEPVHMKWLLDSSLQSAPQRRQ